MWYVYYDILLCAHVTTSKIFAPKMTGLNLPNAVIYFFNMVSHIVMTSNHKTIFVTASYLKFCTVMNNNENI